MDYLTLQIYNSSEKQWQAKLIYWADFCYMAMVSFHLDDFVGQVWTW